ncbi:MAG: hypothetical protein Unbinned338contig1000_60 [Prokaryotic dsDNA virus sp.]|nr:MAG: hypothetical protein Unbinned338contig1000_60 [Prokaryotic dsDNA virus sp.]
MRNVGFFEWLRGVPEETFTEIGKMIMTFLGFLAVGLIEIRRRVSLARKDDPPRATLEVAGALVSDAHAKSIVTALTENTHALHRNTDAAIRVHDAADDLKLDVRDLRLELRHGKT